jgi:hypothetical protein
MKINKLTILLCLFFLGFSSSCNKKSNKDNDDPEPTKTENIADSVDAKAKEEAEKKATEEIDAKTKEEAEKKAKEEAEKKAKEEADAKTKEEVEKKAKEEAEKKAKEEADAKTKGTYSCIQNEEKNITCTQYYNTTKIEIQEMCIDFGNITCQFVEGECPQKATFDKDYTKFKGCKMYVKYNEETTTTDFWWYNPEVATPEFLEHACKSKPNVIKKWLEP